MSTRGSSISVAKGYAADFGFTDLGFQPMGSAVPSPDYTAGANKAAATSGSTLPWAD